MVLVSKEFKPLYDLLAAQLEEVESSIENGIGRILRGKEPKNEFYEELEYVYSNAEFYHSFVNVCLHLGINPDNYRKRLNNAVVKALKEKDIKKAKIAGLHKLLSPIQFDVSTMDVFNNPEYRERKPAYGPSP